MSSYEKPQSPLYHKTKDTYFYPLTTVDQVIMDDDSRLNAKMLTIDVHNANEAEPNGINADKLGGYDASEYVRKDQSSVEVNYRVVNNLTKPESEDSLTQNMIWIDTDVPIGRVFFGNNEPNEAFIDGDVWICTGTKSNAGFNALRIGGNYVNMIYPIYAKQMGNDGNLVDVTAKSWQNGEWVEWIHYLLNVSPVVEWQPRAWRQAGDSFAAGVPTITQEANGVKISLNNGKYTGVYEISEDEDLTNVSYVRFSGLALSSTSGISGSETAARLCVGNRNGTYALASAIVQQEVYGVNAPNTVDLDVRTLNNKYDIYILLTNGGTITVREVHFV